MRASPTGCGCSPAWTDAAAALDKRDDGTLGAKRLTLETLYVHDGSKLIVEEIE